MFGREPDLTIDARFFATEAGGRKTPLRGDLRPWYSCPCMLHANAREGWDCRLDIAGLIIAPGETKRLPLYFLSPEQALPLFRAAGRFYLWEGNAIGEATIVN